MTRHHQFIHRSAAAMAPLPYPHLSLHSNTHETAPGSEIFLNASRKRPRGQYIYVYTSYTHRRHYFTSSNLPARRQMLFGY
jgi:hypothetical protein